MSEQFIERLHSSRDSIDLAISSYEFSDELTADVYRQLLERGGKRIRGALTINGYEMAGGNDRELALQASVAVEMMHAYILIIDDIQDRSAIRRGGPTAHKMFEYQSRTQGWEGDHAHTGISLALNSALYGAHRAQNIFASLDVASETASVAQQLMNETMVVTAFGQSGDIINEVSGEVTIEDVDKVLLQKTAHYTILNPLQIGMCLSGSPPEDLEKIRSYSMEVGRAFQIIDDLLLFSSDQDKQPEQDIKEGKMTLLSCYALKHADDPDKIFLQEQLGNQQLTLNAFERCKSIMINSGARDYALAEAKRALSTAEGALDKFPGHWNKPNVLFLKGLIDYLLAKAEK